MDQKIKKIFISLTLFFLILPGSQFVFHLIPKASVHGVAIPEKFPKITWKDLISDKYQTKATDFLMRGNILWPWMLKLNNQLFYSIFNQISAHSNGSIVCAQDGTFFQPMYLTSFNREKPYSEAKLGKIPAEVKELQDILAKKGIPLVMLVSPNRIALQPDLVPPSRIDPTRFSRKNSYEVMPAEFNKLGVNMVDMFAFFQNQSKPGYIDVLGEKAKVPVFLPTASHWNELGSCLAVNEVVKKINSVKGSSIPLIKCEEFDIVSPPPSADLDLLEIGNLLLEKRMAVPGPVIKGNLESVSQSIQGQGKKPKILLIGTSFLFAIQKHLEKTGLISEAPLLFYYRQQRNSSSQRFHNIRKKKLFSEEYILSFDAVVLETNQASIGKIGHGFVKEALVQFKKNKFEKN